jgi:aminoglycoside phosphotransferase family enzyme/predicted kinase
MFDTAELASRADRIVQTHASVVYLLGDRAFKVKKPVDFGFLDYSTPERRKWFCDEEVRLNRRWCADLYLGVVPLPSEWAVEMRRYPEGSTLLDQLDVATPDLLRRVGERLAQIHATCPTGPAITALADWPVVAANHRENFEQTSGTDLIPGALHERLHQATEAALDQHRARIHARARTHAREIHGDLRLQHTLVRGERIDFVDCIEFNERFRFADPLADVAFLYMDLAVRGRNGLAEALWSGWEQASGDHDAGVLLPLELAYRSIVRAKVAGFEAADPSVDPEQTARARDRSRRHWLYAASVLLPPAERPCLVGIGGLPGTGKSTLAASVGRERGMDVVRADVVRKELAGLPPTMAGSADLYAPKRKDAVYDECFRRAREGVAAGRRVLIDATFSDPRQRDRLRASAIELGVPGLLVLCEAPAEVSLSRIAGRGPDASDADAHVYRSAAARWSPDPKACALATGGSLAEAERDLRKILVDARL